jgi:Rps23 Pro-64 3,4-dihydroxylase Tpa1-like proline 4-hydroxylase
MIRYRDSPKSGRMKFIFSKPAMAEPVQEAGGAPSIIEPFTEDSLSRLASIDNYSTASPFPHLVIDDFFDPRVLDHILDEWPDLETPNVDNYHDGTYTKLKYASNYRMRFGPYTRCVLARLAEPPFLEALEKVTGINGLVPDPYVWGGGLHFTRSGGRLAVHADFNKHFKFKLDRRLNLLLYLNRDWTETNQGWLELWDRDMKSWVKRILPVFNRTVIFSTTDFSFHGQPEAIQGPPDLFRRSLALYYYSNGRPAEEVADRDPGATLWQKRPGSGY